MVWVAFVFGALLFIPFEMGVWQRAAHFVEFFLIIYELFPGVTGQGVDVL